MPTNRLRPALVFAVWTLLVWTTRIRNVWTDGDLTVAGQVVRTALALVFTGFALVTVAAFVEGRRRDRARPAAARWVRAFALWTSAVWVVRSVQIATAGHDLGFVLVHLALAVISVGLAARADRVARSGRVRTSGQRTAEVGRTG